MTGFPLPQSLLDTLPPPPAPVGMFMPARTSGGLVYLSGLAPLDDDGQPMTGKVGAEVTPHEARLRARRVGLALLANLRAEVGDLNRVDRVVKMLGLVNATPDFTGHPQVIDGCSEVFFEAFGPDAGRHARTSMGVASLPGNISCEVELIVALR
ncbi:RidA family protein [Pseudooceanicola sediminis]|uniref:RidA family protein n=1 Tax=Pseudooceanicola sediminis TaxID=2211117 RepID=A0A399J4R7_9RHOB|nr:RidA family protein [Pseudooceanicola sediminis]KAA2317223.1 RidA family protein [Puniceibacterium sp. HSS470]RII39577.1 RidA family protein [Pseudooceanicola sediminis]|tara:strand:- start:30148 stop:30609 length:462 start_codon:yes stop_codon:yes gene_type:complete